MSLKLDPKPSEAAFSALSSNFDIRRPETAGDDISGAAENWVGLSVLVKFGDLVTQIEQWPNYSALCRPEPFSALFAGFSCILHLRTSENCRRWTIFVGRPRLTQLMVTEVATTIQRGQV